MNYFTCRSQINERITETETDSLQIEQCLHRVISSDLSAILPQPEFDQSLRDGYIIGTGEGPFTVSGMIQAGETALCDLAPGQAIRIMTGALAPVGGKRVIPQENCQVIDERLLIAPEAMNAQNTFIQKKGSRIETGDVIASRGTVLTAAHIGRLTSVGHHQLPVYQKPRVGYFCTGSELLDRPDQLKPGLKVSSNRLLLDGLIKLAGGIPVYLGTIEDKPETLDTLLKDLQKDQFDMVISTGGMGPGKYDLVEKSFLQAGGEVVYSQLDLIPGKNSLFGLLGNTLFFGLPGPPSAVRAMMNAIVSPTLIRMQGVRTTFPSTIQAFMLKTLNIKRPGIMQLRPGVLRFDQGKCYVEESATFASSRCYMVISADKNHYNKGELIDIHLVDSPFCSFS